MLYVAILITCKIQVNNSKTSELSCHILKWYSTRKLAMSATLFIPQARQHQQGSTNSCLCNIGQEMEVVQEVTNTCSEVKTVESCSGYIVCSANVLFCCRLYSRTWNLDTEWKIQYTTILSTSKGVKLQSRCDVALQYHGVKGTHKVQPKGNTQSTLENHNVHYA